MAGCGRAWPGVAVVGWPWPWLGGRGRVAGWPGGRVAVWPGGCSRGRAAVAGWLWPWPWPGRGDGRQLKKAILNVVMWQCNDVVMR